ncbi:HNH endonuclease signature motif containing protein [uncultured Microbacterium sp.]|uniref:HNH endonuclease signature motif containing protein n=1 Tax=uncultured Microbacterium sp. TaxID=191216 RepID=UPI0025D63E3E|nr:HNH endonuclease signature motif containing protein [uncultured Microbacterium sp.]
MDVSAPTDRLRAASASVVGLLTGRDVEALDDRALVGLMSEITAARNALDVLAACAARVIDARSARERGGAGLAQKTGHRNATELLQSLTGLPRRDVIRSVTTGGDLLPAVRPDGEGFRAVSAVVSQDAGGAWLDRLSGALRDGVLGHAQFQAIRVGLGEPPVQRYPELDPDVLPRAWAAAVERLIDEAPHLPVEEVRASALIARDRLDPVGVTLRFEERFAARSFRSWTDEHGQRHGRFVFDDDAAAWVDAILQAALRPRRGPRFVDPNAARTGPGTGSDALADASDERSGEQIAYDTLIAVMRTGAAADPARAFGDRQPGVRIVVEASAVTTGGSGSAGGRSGGGVPRIAAGVGGATSAETVVRGVGHLETVVRGVGHLEDGGEALPGGVVESYLCDAGAVTVTLGDAGRPLDVGRHQRLFTRAQRTAIAVRDGGCVGIGCRAPISQCEMHHIDHWAADRGRTDVDDGVPLCRNHHLGLHNRGEKIVRERDLVTGRDSYWLHAPPDPLTGEVKPPALLRSRSPRRFGAA